MISRKVAIGMTSLLLGAFTQAAVPKKLIVKYKSVSSGAFFSTSSKTQNVVKQDVFQKEVKVVEDVSAEVTKLSKNPFVEYVEEDLHMTIAKLPGDDGGVRDSRFFELWGMSNNSGGANFTGAWDITTGSNSIVVAVLDTGITNHSDLSGKILPGVDMISDPAFGNDGNGRDTDPSDPGDWVTFGDSCYNQTGPTNSSWHGTHVAGTIGAVAANGAGVTGGSWGARIVPVRVLGKCGGYSSDIADGIRWAAGISVSGLPVNANPAKVINLSLGGPGACGNDMQSAINEAKARGSVVVVAAGNFTQNLQFTSYSPANCRGVIVVGASTQGYQQASYSNYGDVVDVMAPGGSRSFSSSTQVLSTSNSGTSTPSSETYKYQSGTSMAAPHVAALAQLIFSVNNGLYPDQVEKIIRETAQSAFSCTGGNCSYGVIDAYQALLEAQGTSPDPNYTSPESTGVRSPIEAEVYRIESDGGMCGTIDMEGGNTNGPGGGMVIMTLLAILSISSTRKKLFSKS